MRPQLWDTSNERVNSVPNQEAFAANVLHSCYFTLKSIALAKQYLTLLHFKSNNRSSSLRHAPSTASVIIPCSVW